MFFLIDRMRNGPFVFDVVYFWMLHFGLMACIRIFSNVKFFPLEPT